LPSRINTPPIGLQDLLGSQAFGDNPSELLELVQPTLDLLPFLSEGKLDAHRVSEDLVSPIQATTLSIDQPQGELWIPLTFSVGIQGNDVAGTTFAAYFRVRNHGFPSLDSALDVPMAGTFVAPASTTSGEETRVSWQPPVPFSRRGPCKWDCRVSPYVQGGGGSGQDSFEFAIIHYKYRI